MRWLEQLERKHFEILRVIRTFRHTNEVWLSCAGKTEHTGKRAFAKRQAAIYQVLAVDATHSFESFSSKEITGGLTISHVTHADLIEACVKNRERIEEELQSTLCNQYSWI